MQSQTSTVNPTRVVVIGAGYAGLLASLRLARRTRRQPVQITLVNASDTFVERTRLHQQASGQTLKTLAIPDLLTGTKVHFVPGKVVALHPDRRQLTVQSETTQAISYDFLFYALGSHTAQAQLPGANAHAYALEQFATVAEQLGQLAPQARILVIGGGLTGIEAVTEIAERYPHLHVTLATHGALGADLSPAGARYLQETLHKLGVVVRTQTKISRLTAAQAVTATGEALPFDLCLYTAGFAVSPLAQAAGLAVNGNGQVLVDGALRSVSHSNIYAIGDAATFAAACELPLRMACATALPMAAHAAENLARRLAGKAEHPFRFGYVIRCISLGRQRGLVQWVDGVDAPRRWVLTGRLGAWVKERILDYTVWTLRLERYVRFYNWPQSRSAQPATSVPTAQLAAESVQG